jgi:hypothetical protein
VELENATSKNWRMIGGWCCNRQGQGVSSPSTEQRTGAHGRIKWLESTRGSTPYGHDAIGSIMLCALLKSQPRVNGQGYYYYCAAGFPTFFFIAGV